MYSIEEILKEKYKNTDQEIILDGADLVSEKGYTLIPNYVLQTNRISGRAKLVYAMLLSYAWGNKDSSFPGQDTLAEGCGSSPRSVWSAIKELEKAKFITIIRRGLGKTNVYVLHFKKPGYSEEKS